MTKRRLNKQQQSRIARNQQRELGEQPGSQGDAGLNCNGRIVSHFGQQLEVESLEPGQAGHTYRCHQRANLPKMVTGDLVVWEEDQESGQGVIIAVAPRRSLFGRADAHGAIRPIAANLDMVLVVIATVPQSFPNLIDRYLVAIETLNLPLRLIVNKCDLRDEASSAYIDNILSIYGGLGYPVHEISVKTGAGLPELSAALAGQTTVLVGQSGVGKSSIINGLAPDGAPQAIIGELSVGKAKGTHTTTTAKLHHLAGFDLIDSPGIREFSLGHVSPDEVFFGFRELRQYSGQCKFRDCSHQSEPGCAILAALAAGDIRQERFDSYRQILQTLAPTES